MKPNKTEHTIIDEDLLHIINENIPAKTCAAHPILLVYIKNITKNVNQGFKEINEKIDPISDYITEAGIEKKADEQVENKEVKAEKKWEIKRDHVLQIIIVLLGIMAGFIGLFTFIRGL